MPVVKRLGPRRVGQTTLARAISRDCGARAVCLAVERPANLRRLDDADACLRA
jgi:hypothetical protein